MCNIISDLLYVTVAKLLLPDSILAVQYNGVQRQSLYDVVTSSVHSVIEPYNAFELLYTADLIPNNTSDEVIVTMKYVVVCRADNS